MKLNFACGDRCWPGFDNSDIVGRDNVRQIDLTKPPYPYEDGAASLILISHALQMTTDGEPVHSDHRPIFAEFHRILEPGGWVRVDDNPDRFYRDGEPSPEAAAESLRGFPAHLRIPRDDLIGLLGSVGFRPVLEPPAAETRIPADDATRAAIVGNHEGHVSFTLEAQKPSEAS